MSSRHEWLEFRRTGIGSSDMPIILGLSPWSTPLELWKEKTGRLPLESEPNVPQRHGINTEPKARAAYELLNDMDMPAQVFRHPKYPFLIASLDGWNQEHRRILEIKCPLGMADHQTAKEGMVPEKYEWQVRHQLMVTEAEIADYFSYFQPKPELIPDHVLLQVRRDQSKEPVMLEKAEAFWQLVQSDTPPPLTARDYLELSDPHAVALCEMWKESRALGMKKQMEEIREEMRRYLIHPRVECAGVRLLSVQRKNGLTFEVRLKGEVCG